MFLIMAAHWAFGTVRFDRPSALVVNGVVLFLLGISMAILRFGPKTKRPIEPSVAYRRRQGAIPPRYLTLGSLALLSGSWFSAELAAHHGWLTEIPAETARYFLIPLASVPALVMATDITMNFHQDDRQNQRHNRLTHLRKGMESLVLGSVMWHLTGIVYIAIADRFGLDDHKFVTQTPLLLLLALPVFQAAVLTLRSMERRSYVRHMADDASSDQLTKDKLLRQAPPRQAANRLAWLALVNWILIAGMVMMTPMREEVCTYRGESEPVCPWYVDGPFINNVFLLGLIVGIGAPMASVYLFESVKGQAVENVPSV